MGTHLFPLDDVQRYLTKVFQDIRRDGSTLSFSTGNGTTTLSVKPSGLEVKDGPRIGEIVSLRHEPTGLNGLSLEKASYINRFATLSALIVGVPGLQATHFVSKVGIFSTDKDAAERLYAPMLAMEAGTIPWWSFCIENERFELGPEESVLPMTGEPPPFDETDYARACEVPRSAGLHASYSANGVTFELPWDDGAVSSVYRHRETIELMRDQLRQDGLDDREIDRLGGRTSLVTIKSNVIHPRYGKGLQCILRLGVSVEDGTLAESVEALNQWELSRADLPPLFGSWCSDSLGLAFVTFIPTSYCVDGLPKTLVYWAGARHARVREYLAQATQG